jgi:hypothetical protein
MIHIIRIAYLGSFRHDETNFEPLAEMRKKVFSALLRAQVFKRNRSRTGALFKAKSAGR